MAREHRGRAEALKCGPSNRLSLSAAKVKRLKDAKKQPSSNDDDALTE